MIFETRVIIGVGGRKVTCDWYMFVVLTISQHRGCVQVVLGTI